MPVFQKIKVIISCIAVVFFINQTAFAQNFRFINPERVRTYALENGNYFFVNIDSVQVSGTDSTFYFKQRVDTVPAGCGITTNNFDIMGPKVSLISDSIYYFFNKNLDTIKLLADPLASTPWVMYKYPDGRYIEATYTTLSYSYIMPGIQDSMKTYKFDVYDSLGANLNDSVPDGLNMDITKNFGIVEFIDFNNFPDDTTNFKLRGISNPDTQVVNLDSHNAFDFSLGNEFHYREEIVPDNNSAADKRISAWKYFVMAKNQEAESVTYTMERVRIDTLYFDGIPSSSVLWDTLDVVINYVDYAVLDTIELSLLQQDNYGYSDWIKNDSIYMGIPHKYVYDWFTYDDAAHCLSNPENISQPEQIYGDGLGIIHYKDSADADNYYKLDMVYFQVGLLVWGTPYDFSNLDVQAVNSTLNKPVIYPNPVTNYLMIDNLESGKQYSYAIIDMQGSTVLHDVIVAGERINTAPLSQGIYSLQVTSDAERLEQTFVKLLH